MGYMTEEQEEARMQELDELIAAGWGSHAPHLIPPDWRTRRPEGLGDGEPPSKPKNTGFRGGSANAARDAAKLGWLRENTTRKTQLRYRNFDEPVPGGKA